MLCTPTVYWIDIVRISFFLQKCDGPRAMIYSNSLYLCVIRFSMNEYI